MMNKVLDLASFSFHDISLVGIVQNRSNIELKIEFFDEADVEHATSVTILNIEAILKEDVAIDRLEMETEDGEIYDLSRRDNGMELIVIWNECRPLTQRLCVYELLGSNVVLQPGEVLPIERSGSSS